MEALMAEHLLDAWERGLDDERPGRAVALLAAAGAGAASDLARLPLGRRDALLLRLRERLFGSRMVSLITCPACRQQVELEFEVGDIRIEPSDGGGVAFPLDVDRYSIQARLPDSTDLAAAHRCARDEDARRLIVRRCVLSACHEGAPVDPDMLPEPVLACLGERMGELDPQAQVRLSVSCPHCGHGTRVAFDIASFLWEELDAWAKRTLWDVHLLAATYGWSEAQVLRLGHRRRALYLDMVRA